MLKRIISVSHCTYNTINISKVFYYTSLEIILSVVLDPNQRNYFNYPVFVYIYCQNNKSKSQKESLLALAETMLKHIISASQEGIC